MKFLQTISLMMRLCHATTRLGRLAMGLVLIGTASGASTAVPAKRVPNVVIILVDDMGWKDVACYGNPFCDTPNIDRLAREGVRFTQAYAAASICSPSRAALWTGRAPARVGITDYIDTVHFPERIAAAREGGAKAAEYQRTKSRSLLTPPNKLWLEHDEITIAEMVKPLGYQTMYVGKWHLGWKEWYPETQGFDVNVGGSEFGLPPSYFDPYQNKTFAKEGFPNLPPRKTGEYLESRLAEATVGLIHENRDRPFFLVHAHYAVHTPVQAAPELLDRYKEQTRFTPHNPVYAAMIGAVDRVVGQILQAIKDEGLEDNTIVIFTSDNGGAMTSDETFRLKDSPLADNMPLRAGKGYPFEGGLRIPLIVKWPGVVAPGRTDASVVVGEDIFPTVCEMTGAVIPKEHVIDGLSLVSLLKKSAPLPPRAVFWHFPHYRGDHVVPYSIVRQGDWKLIKQYEGKPFQLFKLTDDAGESHDLSAAQPDKVGELDRVLEAWLKAVDAKIPRQDTTP